MIYFENVHVSRTLYLDFDSGACFEARMINRWQEEQRGGEGRDSELKKGKIRVKQEKLSFFGK